jgi:type VI secretion system protein ImpH
MASQGSRPPAGVTPRADEDRGSNIEDRGSNIESSAVDSPSSILNPRSSTRRPLTVADRLFTEGYVFDFFQAVRLLEKLEPGRLAVGHAALPGEETVRFRAKLALDFPASAIHEIVPPTEHFSLLKLVAAFMGLTGPSGVLPRHYTEMLLRLERDSRHPDRSALRDWLDLFNHRLISLFYRAWEKYRFYIPYERGEYDYPEKEQDAFTRTLFSLIGLGTSGLRHRLRVATRPPGPARPEKPLARIDDLALLRFGGFLSHRPRNAISLQALLSTYLEVPVQVQQFQGQWLRLEDTNQSSLGNLGANNAMGNTALIGDRVWDIQSRIRIRVGPLTYERFLEFLPDTAPVPQRKAIFLLAHLVRLYLGVETDFDVQLVLLAPEVPMCGMGRAGGSFGSRIGWNSWSRSRRMAKDVDQAIFVGQERIWVSTTIAE